MRAWRRLQAPRLTGHLCARWWRRWLAEPSAARGRPFGPRGARLVLLCVATVVPTALIWAMTLLPCFAAHLRVMFHGIRLALSRMSLRAMAKRERVHARHSSSGGCNRTRTSATTAGASRAIGGGRLSRRSLDRATWRSASSSLHAPGSGRGRGMPPPGRGASPPCRCGRGGLGARRGRSSGVTLLRMMPVALRITPTAPWLTTRSTVPRCSAGPLSAWIARAARWHLRMA